MRVALCIFGLVGNASKKYFDTENINFEIPYLHYKKNLIDIHKGEVDVFVHSQSYYQKENILKLYQPKLFKIEKQQDFSRSANHPSMKNIYLLKIRSYFEKLIGMNDAEEKVNLLYTKLYAYYSRWYSFQQSIKLKKKYEEEKNIKYDLVFGTRFDVILKKKFYLNIFDSTKLTLSNHNTIPAPSNNYQTHPLKDNQTDLKGFSDLWFASSSKNMDNFGNLFDRITQYPINAHFASQYHARHLGLKLDFKFYRYFDYELLRRINKSEQ